MTVTKGKKFRKGNMLLQYWYEDGKAHSKKLMIIAIGSKVLARALVYAYGKTVTNRSFWERAFSDY